MYRYFKAEVVANQNINRHFKLLSLHPLSEIVPPEAGQFYMLQAGESYDPLLKRPLSIFKRDGHSLQFLYRIRGKGTLALSDRKTGDVLQVIGPIGNGYPAPEGDFIAVAGGIGIASLLPLLEKFPRRATLFYGARDRKELVMVEEARAVSKEMIVATDDGSAGEKGLVTELLKEYLKDSNEPVVTSNSKNSNKLKVTSNELKQEKEDSSDSLLVTPHSSLPSDSSLVTRYSLLPSVTRHSLPIYACGPTPMLRELHRIVSDKGIQCFVSLEEHMACGVGACLGCVVKIRSQKSEYKRVCKEGPVFDIEDVVW